MSLFRSTTRITNERLNLIIFCIKETIKKSFYFISRFSFSNMSGLAKHYVDMKVKARHVMMFAKSTDPDSQKAKQILENYLSQGK